ncbi:cystathionine gamma-synthase family protein [Oceanospirillaceae bacterium]|jgi:cystathionine gamma-synthase|uniref:cystathionine gamma-synthase family protein n=1 Tax=Candidatus Njordibacter sp. Uisw_002 TaxID=3230971 RepID=UPI0023362CCA|nr:cystathionine gamma-synthase family protein [Oceanospirillaceae bacterium]|tara:strand:+ start:274 stop:1458 length:1185 start_codon:yes stop_codon:yes gene_type:complete
MRTNIGKSTQSIWGGEQEHELYERSTQVPVVHSVSFAYKDIDTWHKVALGEEPGHIYSRNTNPTVRAFEDKVKVLEGAQAATSFSSGMAAISNTLATFLKPGDRVVSIKDSYGGTNVIFNEFLPPLGIEVALCATGDYEELETQIDKGCTLLYLETPTNPTIKIVDIKRLSAKAHSVGALVVVDNTFATPINQLPLELGADIVLHSASKYLGGHADALGGVICASKELVQQVYHYREINGATLAPMDAYSLLRGMKTLKLRVERQNDNAMAVARYLESHPMVEQVNYPGLESHAGHDIAKQQMSGFGGMLSFSVHGGLDAIKKFLPRLNYAHMAANLGCVETVVGPPVTTSHVECTAQERAAAGIPEGLVRYSTGIEDIEDLINDLEQALSVLK